MTEDGSDADEAPGRRRSSARLGGASHARLRVRPPRIAESSAAVVNVLTREGDAEFASEAETAAQPGSPALTGLLPAA